MSRFKKKVDSFVKGVGKLSRFEKISLALMVMNNFLVALALV